MNARPIQAFDSSSAEYEVSKHGAVHRSSSLIGGGGEANHQIYSTESMSPRAAIYQEPFASPAHLHGLLRRLRKLPLSPLLELTHARFYFSTHHALLFENFVASSP